MIAPIKTAPRRSLCGDCLLENVCAKAKATVPSLATIKKPQTRLAYQNHLVRLQMPYGRLIDHHVHALRDFLGRYENEVGATVPAPGIARLLTPGAEFRFRDQIEHGRWTDVEAVPKLRSEARGRWVIVGTVKNITETVQPLCNPR